MKAPFSQAQWGNIQGIGFASAKIIGFQFIQVTHQGLSAFQTETPIKISAALRASLSQPLIDQALVNQAICFLQLFRSDLPLQIVPLVSHTKIVLKPYSKRSLAIVSPAAPAPLMTTLHSEIGFLLSLRALMSPASTTTAVPCWSSWKIGSPELFFKFSSISKQLGAEISSRLIAANPLRIFIMALVASFVSFRGLMHIGITFTSPSCLNKHDLPYITGRAARQPILPRPSTAVPSVIIAQRFRLLVILLATDQSSSISLTSLNIQSLVANSLSRLILRQASQLCIFPCKYWCKKSEFSLLVNLERSLSMGLIQV